MGLELETQQEERISFPKLNYGDIVKSLDGQTGIVARIINYNSNSDNYNVVINLATGQEINLKGGSFTMVKRGTILKVQ